jgi:hypothetical protein
LNGYHNSAIIKDGNKQAVNTSIVLTAELITIFVVAGTDVGTCVGVLIGFDVVGERLVVVDGV